MIVEAYDKVVLEVGEKQEHYIDYSLKVHGCSDRTIFLNFIDEDDLAKDDYIKINNISFRVIELNADSRIIEAQLE